MTLISFELGLWGELLSGAVANFYISEIENKLFAQ